MNINKALAENDVVTITGLTFASTATNANIDLTGTEANKFKVGSATSKAAWDNSGSLTLTVASGGLATGATTIKVALTNKATAVSAVTPQIAATIAGAVVDDATSVVADIGALAVATVVIVVTM